MVSKREEELYSERTKKLGCMVRVEQIDDVEVEIALKPDDVALCAVKYLYNS